MNVLKEQLGHEIMPAPCLASQCSSRQQAEVVDMLLSYDQYNTVSVVNEQLWNKKICVHFV